MVFSSTLFLVWFLPLFLIGYYFIDARFKNNFVLAASVLFYAWGGPVFIFAILLTTFFDFHLVKWMAAETDAKKRKLKLLLPLAMNLGLLAYFKYANFFVENTDGLLRGLGLLDGYWEKIVLPIGISFYTFESITYMVDVYRKTQPPLTKFRDYQLYILFFPKLLVGPIVRYHDFGPQIYNRIETDALRLAGFYRIVTGLAKKLLIANTLGVVSNFVFTQDVETLPSTWAWLGLLAYTLQIYFDFAGYTDIAIGLGQTMGFRLPENFDNPYTSRSITEFWQRWHITLGGFLRNYLYIPLSGNQKGAGRTMMNLWIVFLVSGLWHGASWNCLLWGVWHGTFLVAERLFLGRLLARVPGFISMGYTILFVGLALVLFWPDTLSHAAGFYEALFRFSSAPLPLSFDREFWFTLILALFFTYWTVVPALKRIHDNWFITDRNLSAHYPMAIICVVLFFICLSYAAWSPFNPFIYLRF
jgi:alginate O-acetyltransferase complex protein AlgI